jgi:NAD(P)-dependent dehydrogenase (short-subunit alcohol dehydrogenase family)
MQDYAAALGKPETGVVVSGGASGIGLASAEALAAVGRPVALLGRRGDKVRAEADRLTTYYCVKAVGIGADMCDPAAVAAAVVEARAALGPLGGLVHSAGNMEPTGIAGVTLENWQRGMDTHVRSFVLLTQAMLEDFRVHPGGSVVAISSVNATLGNPYIPIYTAAKGALRSLVRAFADELARYGASANAIAPGLIQTAMTETVVRDPASASNRMIMLGRCAQPSEVGRVVRFMLSEEASFITGTELLVDGGAVHSQRV